MDAMTNGVDPSVVTFEKICTDAVSQSALTLNGHVSAAAFNLALATVVDTRTGIIIDNWGIGGQFVPSERVSPVLPPGLLAAPRRHLSAVTPGEF